MVLLNIAAHQPGLRTANDPEAQAGAATTPLAAQRPSHLLGPDDLHRPPCGARHHARALALVCPGRLKGFLFCRIPQVKGVSQFVSMDVVAARAAIDRDEPLAQALDQVIRAILAPLRRAYLA